MAISFEELTGQRKLHLATSEGKVTLLPDPPRAERRYSVISCDDHIVEPPHAFEGRVPAKFADRAPRVVERIDGVESWLFEGQMMPNVGFNAVAGRRSSEYSFDPTRFEHMRRGAWDIEYRLARHGPRRCVRVVVFPVVPARVRRPAHYHSSPTIPSSRSRSRARGTTGCSKTGWLLTGPHDPVAAAVPARSRVDSEIVRSSNAAAYRG